MRAYFAELKEIGPDALIISDPGVYRIAMEVCPEIERHISTQANNTNYGTYQFWYEQGAKRVVTARELSLVFRTLEDVCCPIILQEEMRTRELVHIRAGGSMRSWKSPDRGSICRCMRMREGRISLTRKIFV